MPRYRVEAYNASDELIADLSGRHTNFLFRKRRNRSDVLTLTYDTDNVQSLCDTLNITIQELFSINQTTIKAYRDDTLLVAGQLSYIAPRISGRSSSIKVICYGWFELLGQRITGVAASGGDWYYSSTDAGAIAWDLIDTSQNLTNGDFGITQGTIQTSVNRDRTEYEYDNIRDLIIALSEVENGFDFEITPDKVFNVYYPKIGIPREDIVFTFPGNITDLSFSKDGSTITNKVYAVGSGFGSDRSQATAEDTTSQASYALRESVKVFNNISSEDVLQEHANELLSGSLNIISLKVNGLLNPQFGSYGIGDEVMIQVDEKLAIFNEANDTYTIEEYTLNANENEDEEVEVVLSR